MKDNSHFLAINAQCCCFNLRKITRVITQYYDRSLEPSGLRCTQFNLLINLINSSAKTLTEMAEGLMMDRTTLTRNLRPLEKLGLITSSHVHDKRSKAYVLSELGTQTLYKGIPLWEAAHKRMMAEFGQDKYVHLLSELNLLKAATLIHKYRDRL